MKAIETKAQVDTASVLTITTQVPVDVQAGEYEVMVVLNPVKSNNSEQFVQDNNEKESRVERWQKWFEAVDQLPLEQDSSDKSFEAILVDKYRKQGLDL
ncbi:MAG: hypothetical protein AAFR58_01475 [Cyanobacteria bacterium J06627_28]